MNSMIIKIRMNQGGIWRMEAPKKFGRGSIRQSRPHTTLLTVAIIYWSASLSSFAEPRDFLPKVDKESPPGQARSTLADQQRAFQNRQALLPLLYRDQKQLTTYKAAHQALNSGRSLEAVQLLQELFTANEDSFYWPQSNKHPISIRTAAHNLLQQQGRSHWKLYEQLYQAPAAALLKLAHEQHDLTLYQQVVRQYAPTTAALTAQRYLAHHALDRCHFHEAHRYMQQVIHSDMHRNHLTENDYRLFDFLEKQIHRENNNSFRRVEEIRTAMAPTRAVRDVPVISISRNPARLYPSEKFQSIRTKPVGTNITPPYLDPTWSMSYTGSTTNLLDKMLRYWEQEQAKELKSCAIAWTPVVFGKTVYVRDYDNIVAYDLKTGKEQWRYACESQFSSLLHNFKPHNRTHSRTQLSQITSELNLNQLLVGNSLLGSMTHDNERLYFIDEIELDALKSPVSAGMNLHRDSVFDDSLARRRTNSLIALPLQQTAVAASKRKPIWQLGGLPDKNKLSKPVPLAGHFLLGPPLVRGTELYVMSEFEQQINLTALEASSGEVLWSQGIGWVEVMIDQDTFRSHRAATPVLAHDLLLCPCQTGVLVAVERTSGKLRWVYDYRESIDTVQQRRWSRRTKTYRGHLGFGDAPLVQGKRVLYLPQHSDNLHCLNLENGKRLWKEARKETEYLGVIEEDIALVVGRRYCRGISIRNGQEEWSVRLGATSGRGTVAGRAFLLPLQSGGIASLNIQTGEYTGLSHLLKTVNSKKIVETNRLNSKSSSANNPTATNWKPGNLSSHAGYVISAGRRQVSIYPQAITRLISLNETNQTISAINNSTVIAESSPQTSLQEAELQLILNNLPRAQQMLEECLEQDHQYSPTENHKIQHLFKELLFARLRTEQTDRHLHFNRLREFAQRPADQGRLLMEEAEFHLTAGNYQQAWDNVVELANYDLYMNVSSINDTTHQLTPRSWIPNIRRRILSASSGNFLHRFQLLQERSLDHALRETDINKLNVYLTLYGEGPLATKARARLAQLHLEASHFQQAELMWLRERESKDVSVSLSASDNLMKLWKRFGLYQMAARETVLLQDKLAEEITNIEQDDSMLKLCVHQQREFSEPVTRVRISENRWTSIGEPLSGYRKALPVSSPSEYTLLTKGSGHTGKLTLLDRSSGTLLNAINVPTGTLSHQLSKRQLCGSQLSLGGSQTAVGVSLLTQKQTWELPDDSTMRKESLRVGPVSPRFTVLRNRHQLAVVETGTGKLLWQRNEIGPPGNRINTGQTGVMGDEKALVTFEDHLNYTVYSTDTGEEIRQGRLTFDPSERHYIFGRKLFYFEPSPEGNYVCLYDPLEDRYLFKRKVEKAILSARTLDNKLAILTPNESGNGDSLSWLLEIIDPQKEQLLLSYDIKDVNSRHLSFLRVFSDHKHYYINLQHHNNSLELPRQYYPAGDTLLNNVTIRGDLLAFDKQSGKLRWRRLFQPCSVLMTDPYRLPCLVLVSRTRDRMNPNRHSLAVEAVNIDTGESLATHPEILTDRLVSAAFDPKMKRLSITGHRTQINIDFYTGPQRVAEQLLDQPF